MIPHRPARSQESRQQSPPENAYPPESLRSWPWPCRPRPGRVGALAGSVRVITFPLAALPEHNPYTLALLRSWSPGRDVYPARRRRKAPRASAGGLIPCSRAPHPQRCDDLRGKRHKKTTIPDLRNIPLVRLAELGTSALAHSIALYRERVKENDDVPPDLRLCVRRIVSDCPGNQLLDIDRVIQRVITRPHCSRPCPP